MFGAVFLIIFSHQCIEAAEHTERVYKLSIGVVIITLVSISTLFDGCPFWICKIRVCHSCDGVRFFFILRGLFEITARALFANGGADIAPSKSWLFRMLRFHFGILCSSYPCVGRCLRHSRCLGCCRGGCFQIVRCFRFAFEGHPT